MPNSLLDVRDGLTRISFVPTPIEVFSYHPELDNEIARQIFRFDFPTFLLPQAHERRLIIAHDNAGIRSTDERTAKCAHVLTVNDRHASLPLALCASSGNCRL